VFQGQKHPQLSQNDDVMSQIQGEGNAEDIPHMDESLRKKIQTIRGEMWEEFS
jgi:hypothetical protein